MKLRRKVFSGDDLLNGVSYLPAITSNYVLLPAEKVLDTVDSVPIIKDMESVKKKTGRLKRTIKPIREYINYRLKNKNKSC
jgi:hypothetical protein